MPAIDTALLAAFALACASDILFCSLAICSLIAVARNRLPQAGQKRHVKWNVFGAIVFAHNLNERGKQHRRRLFWSGGWLSASWAAGVIIVVLVHLVTS